MKEKIEPQSMPEKREFNVYGNRFATETNRGYFDNIKLKFVGDTNNMQEKHPFLETGNFFELDAEGLALEKKLRDERLNDLKNRLEDRILTLSVKVIDQLEQGEKTEMFAAIPLDAYHNIRDILGELTGYKPEFKASLIHHKDLDKSNWPDAMRNDS